MAAMLLAQLGTREKDSPETFAAKLICSIRIEMPLMTLLYNFFFNVYFFNILKKFTIF
jgi:hypothetical protein